MLGFEWWMVQANVYSKLTYSFSLCYAKKVFPAFCIHHSQFIIQNWVQLQGMLNSKQPWQGKRGVKWGKLWCWNVEFWMMNGGDKCLFKPYLLTLFMLWKKYSRHSAFIIPHSSFKIEAQLTGLPRTHQTNTVNRAGRQRLRGGIGPKRPACLWGGYRRCCRHWGGYA